MKNFCYNDDSEDDSQNNDTLNTNSIAKGVFVFKRKRESEKAPPTKKQRRKAPRSTEGPSELGLSAFDYFGLEKKGLESFRGDRYQMYLKLHGILSKLMSDNQKDIFGKVLSNVVQFSKDASHRHLQSSMSQIPTCVLLTGVNLPDHDDMFCNLKQNLLSEVSPHVATIKSANSPSLKLLVLQTVRQLMRQEKDSVADEESSSEEEDDDEKKSQKLIGSLPRLKIWYENLYSKSTATPKKKTSRRSLLTRPPLVIILEDFETFSSQVLQNFILNISMFNELPFVFVFGVATTIDAVHKALPHALTSLLTMQKFTAEPSIEILDRFIKAVVTSPEVTFKVGSKILQLLFETFAFCDLSVKNVLTGYQWCLLEHFSGRPVSILCVDDADKRRKIIMKDLSEKDLDMFMMLSSFRKLVSSNPNDYVGLLKDKNKFRHFLAEKIETLWERTETFNIFVGALHAMAVDLPKDTLGQCFYSVYCSSMSEPVTTSHEYRRTFLYLQHSERSELSKRVKALVDYLKAHSGRNLAAGEVIAEATVFLDRIENFETQGRSDVSSSPSQSSCSSPRSSPRKQSPSTPSCTSSAPSTPSEDSKIKHKFNRFLFQEKLLQEAKEKSREESQKNPFVELRSKVINFFHRIFEKYLGNESTSCLPSKQVFYEVKYFDDVGLLRDNLVGNPRDSLQTALQDPFTYLQHKDLELTTPADIPSCLPDVCIAYKLHLECGRYINLYDWFQCWLSIVSSNDKEVSTPSSSKKSKKTNEETSEDEKLQARFSRAVSELQFLGYIKPSKRKTDHVERLALNC